MKSLRVSDAPPGAQTSVVASGNANTSGDLLDRQQNAEPNTTAFAPVAPQRGATVRSITSNPVNGQGYGPGCHHHLQPDSTGRGGLEVLCHAHHAEITAAQATARATTRANARLEVQATTETTI